MRFSFHSKLALILTLTGVQAVLMAWGVFVFGAWLEDSIRGTVQQQVLAENVQTADQMAKLIRTLEVKDPRHDLGSWEILQETVRGINLPNEGYVCLVDADTSELLCHPDLEEHPTLGGGLTNGGMKKGWKAGMDGANGKGAKPMANKPMANKPMDKGMPGDKWVAGKASKKWAGRNEKQMDSKWSADKQLAGMKGKMDGKWKAPQGSASAGMPGKKWQAAVGDIVATDHGVEVVGVTEIGSINARLMVHQMGSGIDQAVARITDPILPIGLAVAGVLVALTTAAVVFVVRKYESRLAEINRNLEKLVEQRTRSLMKTRNGLIFGLAKLAESRDTDTGEHLERIAKYVTILAKQLKEDGYDFSDSDIEQMALASSLHDIGKVGVPDAVLLKPGRLDPEEREIIETHAKIGGDCLLALSEELGEDDFLQTAEEIAYGHHEKWDGTGYPFQRAGEQIPLSARIVAVADVYDALRSKRPYKDGMPHEKAKSILVKDSGSHFDPVVIEAFLAAEEAFSQVDPEDVVLVAEDQQELATV